MIGVFFLHLKEKLSTFRYRKLLVILLTSFSGLIFSVLALCVTVAVLAPQTFTKELAKLPFITLINRDLGEVLQATTVNPAAKLSGEISFNLPTTFNENIFVDADASVSGTLTAPNILYSVLPGDNIAISGDPQNPTISAIVSDLAALGITAGTGITLAGTTITNSDPGSSQNIFKNITVNSTTISAGSNTDTLELVAGGNITLTTDTSNKKITIAGTSPGISGIIVQEGDTTVNTVTTLDFLGGDFDLTESPSGEANISLATTLTSVTGVAGNFSIGGTTTLNGLTYTWPGSQGSNYLLQTDGAGALTWIDAGSLPNSDKWDSTNGAIYPKNASVLDLLIGGTASNAAKFAVLNVNSGTPTASLSAGITGGAYLTASGSLQTTTFQTLSLGGDTTGNIALSPKNGSGTLSLSANALTINGNSGATAASPTCVSVTNGIVTGSGACGAGSGGSIWTLNTTNGTIYPINNTMDLLIGGTASNAAKFAVLNVAGGTPTASVSAGFTGAAYLTAAGNLQTTAYQSLTLGGDSTGNITISPQNGTGTLTLNLGTLTINGNTGTTSVSPTCVSFTNGVVTGSAACGPGAGGSVWTFNTTNGTLYPINNTMDFFIGGAATTSAKFAILNMAGGTPIASVSAGTPGGAYLTAAGTLQTTAYQTLTLGGDSTGDIVLSPKNASGNLFLNVNALQMNNNPGSTLVSPTCVTTTNGIVTGTGTCSLGAGGSVWVFSSGTGVLYPINNTMDFLLGGVSSSSAAFHVYGASNAQGTTPVASISANTAAAGLIVDNRGVGDLFTASASGAPRFTIKNNGNVEIGTTASTGNQGLTISSQRNAFLVLNADTDDDGGNVGNTYILFNQDGSVLSDPYPGFIGSTQQSNTDPLGNAYTDMEGNALIMATGSNSDAILQFGTNGSVRLTIEDTGRIGIGPSTNNPLANLDVRGFSDTLAVASVSGKSNSFAAMIVDNRGTGDIFTASSSGLPRFVIANNGNIGIGTTLPTQPLDVTGIINASSNITVNGTSVCLQTGTNCPAANTVYWTTISNALSPSGVGNATSDLLIGGVSSTSARFHAYGSINSGTTPAASVSANSNSFAGFVVDNRGTGDIFTASSSGLNRFVIKNNGNIGINVNNPGSPLDIKTLSGVEDDPLMRFFAGDNRTMNIQQPDNADDDDPWVFQTNNAFQFRIESTDALTVSYDNEIGIGVGDPYTQLHLYLSTGSELLLTRGDGTTTTDELLGGIGFDSDDGNMPANILHAAVGIYGYAAEDHSTGDKGGYLTFNTLAIDTNDDTANTERMRLTDAGRLGIGTSTPLGTLHAAGISDTVAVASVSGKSNSFAAMIVDNRGTGDIFTASSSGLTRLQIANNGDTSIWIGTQIGSGGQRLCHSGSDGSNAFVRLADCNTTSADYAEEYGTTDTSIEAGDVVMINPEKNAEEVITNGVKSSKAWIIKTTKAYQASTLGIISTEPNDTIGKSFTEEENARPVALTGRVPVKIASNSAAIKQGDFITASFVPGRAMKAIQAGVVIGKALENWNPQNPSDKILVFVNTTWYDPDIYITSTGNVNIFEKEDAPSLNPASTYGVSMPDGSEVIRTGIFSDAIVGNLKSGSLDVQTLSLGGQNLDDRLLGLESGFASASAINIGPLQTQMESLTSQLSSLTSRVASLEAQLQLLTSDQESPTDFDASSSAELSLDSLYVNGSLVSDTLSVVNYATMNELSVTGSIHAGLLTIKGLSNGGGASISTLNGELKLQDQGFGGVDILNGKVTIDTDGNIETLGEITTAKLNIDTTSVSGAAAGSITIPAGVTVYDINTNALTDDSLIFVTPDKPVVIGAVKKDANTFTIKLQSPTPTAVKVNWWIVN